MAMALLPFSSFFLVVFFLFSSPSVASTSPHPRSVVAPVIKDAATNLYDTTLRMRNPLISVNLTVDLGIVRYLWLACDERYTSQAYRAIPCGTSECSLSGSTRCVGCEQPAVSSSWCHNNTCSLTPENPVPFSPVDTSGEGSADQMALSSATDGKVVIAQNFLFACAPEFLVWQLPNTSRGFAALGRSPLGLPNQLARALGVAPTFALCLPSKTGSRSKGAIIFGGGLYNLQPGVDVSTSLAYTALLTSPVSMTFNPFPREPSYEYFLQLKAIRVAGKPIPVNSSLFNLDKKTGNFGTKLSTVKRFTLLETSIYDALTVAFIKEAAAMGIARVRTKSSSSICFSTKNVSSTVAGPAVPTIEFVLESATGGKGKEVVWKIAGFNSMVFMKRRVACLAFENGGVITPPFSDISKDSAVVIGAHQLEDNLLEFDLKKSVLGFSSSLLYKKTSCSNFNFAA